MIINGGDDDHDHEDNDDDGDNDANDIVFFLICISYQRVNRRARYSLQ